MKKSPRLSPKQSLPPHSDIPDWKDLSLHRDKKSRKKKLFFYKKQFFLCRMLSFVHRVGGIVSVIVILHNKRGL